jgi:hypothetical protein
MPGREKSAGRPCGPGWHLDAAVLRQAALGDVEVGHHLQARDDGRMLLHLGRHDLVQDAVDTQADARAVARDLDVDVAGAVADGALDHRVDHVDHRAGAGHLVDLGVVVRDRRGNQFEVVGLGVDELGQRAAVGIVAQAADLGRRRHRHPDAAAGAGAHSSMLWIACGSPVATVSVFATIEQGHHVQAPRHVAFQHRTRGRVVQAGAQADVGQVELFGQRLEQRRFADSHFFSTMMRPMRLPVCSCRRAASATWFGVTAPRSTRMSPSFSWPLRAALPGGLAHRYNATCSARRSRFRMSSSSGLG